MRLAVTNLGGVQQLNPSIEIELSPAIPASEIMAISCCVHVRAELANHFFGRYGAKPSSTDAIPSDPGQQ